MHSRFQGPRAAPEINYGTNDDALEVVVSRGAFRERRCAVLELTASACSERYAAMAALEAPAPAPLAETAAAVPVACLPAAPEAEEGPPSWGEWRRTRDPSSGKCYYYHSGTGETTWTQPGGWGLAVAPPAPQQPAVPGYMYTDIQGVTQGPFQQAQLVAWRGMLPMELRVWWSDGRGGAGPPSPLAVLLGDADLLALLRSGQLPLPDGATAQQAEQVVAAAEAATDAAGGEDWWAAQQAAQEQGDGDQGGLSFAELAQAALAGLPEEERARVLAGDSGETRPHQAPPEDAYASAPVLNRMTGRVTQASALRGEDALAAGKSVSREYYSIQLDHHMDVSKLDDWIAQMQARKGEKMAPAVWKVLKERRLAKKKEMGTKWLRD